MWYNDPIQIGLLSTMQVDYAKFPDIPPGCQLNAKPGRPGEYQVFREHREIDPETGEKKNVRETLGLIKDGKFVMSKLWLERQEHLKLLDEVKMLRELVGKMGSQVQALKELSGEVQRNISTAAKETHLEQRNPQRTTYPLEAIAIGALVSALTGASSCADISQTINSNKDRFCFFFKDIPYQDVSHDIVYRAFMQVKSERFDAFYQHLLAPMIQKTPYRIISGDGQAIRATGLSSSNGSSSEDRAYMLMNFYDSSNHACLAQQLIEKKTNEIAVGPTMLENLDIRDAVITADAMSCQVGFVNAVVNGGADYCLSLKGNQDRSWSEVSCLFATTHSDQIETYADEVTLAHGRIENRIVSVIRGSLLSPTLKQKWLGLEDGSIVKVRRTVEFKRSGKKTAEDSYYISSLAPNAGVAQTLCRVIRSHWAIENNLHWVLDVNFIQDRTQAIDKDYITNRAALNKLALAMLEHYRFWLWEMGVVKTLPSIRQMQMRCRNFDEALQCIACSQGLLFR